MASPYRHPKTGVYWLRRRTPTELVNARDRLAAHGVKVKAEEKISLRTRDPSEAKRKAHEAGLAFEEVWSEWRRLLSGGPRVLTQKEIFALSAEAGRKLAEKFGDNPGDPERRKRMRAVLADIADSPRADEMAFLEAVLNAILAKLGIPAIAPQSMAALTKQFLKDAPAMAGDLAAMAEGDYSVPEWLAKRPPLKIADTKSSSSSPPVTIESLIVGWQNEMPPSKRNRETERGYRYRIKDFREGLGHDDAAKITADDVAAWRDRMLAATPRLSNRYINGKLQALSTILAWGKRMRKLQENVALGIRVRTDGEKRKRRGFDPEEMKVILKAARAMTKPSDAVRRWAPWVMAYSGARIGEVCQLRCEDIMQDADGLWQIRFTRDAGRLKTQGSERIVPMHPALVAEGFPEYVETLRKRGAGRLFPFLFIKGADNSPDRIADRGRKRTQKWIHGEKGRKGKKARAGLLKPDPALSPNHAWRHAFKTMCRDHGLDQEARDAIQGHYTNGVAPNYGKWNVAAMRRELEKIPAILSGDDDDCETIFDWVDAQGRAANPRGLE